jgi:hypothetical protein
VGGGTLGGDVRMAWIGTPTGGPRSPGDTLFAAYTVVKLRKLTAATNPRNLLSIFIECLSASTGFAVCARPPKDGAVYANKQNE